MSKKNAALVMTVALVFSLVFLNLISLQKFLRFDLTVDQKYTLSDASAKTMQSLEDVMNVTAYFTEDLPMPYASYARSVQDLLEEYRAASKDRLSFEFIDPMQEETENDKAKKKEVKQDVFGRLVREPTSVEEELAQLGIEPVEIRMIEDDRQQSKRAYMGIVIRYQGKQEVIPVIQELSDLEKQITLAMRKLIRKRLPVIAVSSDIPNTSISKWIQLASQSVEIKETQLASFEEIKNADALIIAGLTRKLSAQTLTIMEDFLRSGKGLALLVDRFEIDLQTFQTSVPDEEKSVKSPLWDWLSAHGVNIGYDLLASTDCATINLNEERDGMLLSVPVRYPFISEIKYLDQDSLLTRGLAGVMMPFTSSVQIEKTSQFQSVALVKSSSNSWLEIPPMNTDPKRNWDESGVALTGPYNLLAQVKKTDSKSEKWRFVVAGTSAFMWDPFLNGSNQNLALNLVDWLIADESLLTMRARALVDLPLDFSLGDEAKTVFKYANIFGAPALFLFYGFVRWRRRENRRKKIQHAFN